MVSEKLKPCPFCGGEGEAVCLRVGEDAVASWVRCLSCGVRTQEIEDAYSDLPSASANWNTRAPLSLPQPTVDLAIRLRAYVKQVHPTAHVCACADIEAAADALEVEATVGREAIARMRALREQAKSQQTEAISLAEQYATTRDWHGAYSALRIALKNADARIAYDRLALIHPIDDTPAYLGGAGLTVSGEHPIEGKPEGGAGK